LAVLRAAGSRRPLAHAVDAVVAGRAVRVDLARGGRAAGRAGAVLAGEAGAVARAVRILLAQAGLGAVAVRAVAAGRAVAGAAAGVGAGDAGVAAIADHARAAVGRGGAVPARRALMRGRMAEEPGLAVVVGGAHRAVAAGAPARLAGLTRMA